MGYSRLVTNNCFCDDNDVDDRTETVIAIITVRLKDAIRPIDQCDRN